MFETEIRMLHCYMLVNAAELCACDIQDEWICLNMHDAYGLHI